MDGAVPLGLAAIWRVASVVMLAWLAFFFGRTLPPGKVPLIEQIARVSDPGLKPSLQRYTRLLTAVWTTYFLIASLLALSGFGGYLGAWAGLGSLMLFVGEHWLRPHLFPGESFPSLKQQVRDTWTIWHPQKPE